MVDIKGEQHGDRWSAYWADAVEFCSQMPAASVHLSIYSPPFAQLYIYSDSAADMGNCADDAEFFEQYGFLIREKLRVTKPGRLSAVHCKNLVTYRGRDGVQGIKDFRGDIIRAHQAAGWAYHAETTIWKDPVIEMQRTKAHGLLYKQLRADSTWSRMGMAEYILFFRRSAQEGETIEPVDHDRADFPLDDWQKIASPVWMDIRQTNVLNIQAARSTEDEKHICPLQLDVIERCLRLYSNPGDVVLSPFMGIGSEGVVAVRLGRKFVGVELKDQYWRQACGNLAAVEAEAGDLFDERRA